MAGSLYRGGVNFSNGGPGSPATDISFAPGLSGLTSNNVNSAIIELATIVKNAVDQFTTHEYVYPTGDNTQTVSAFFEKSLRDASREAGAFHVMYLTVSEDQHYIGVTTTANHKCNFSLHSVEDPEKNYTGSFDDSNTDAGFTLLKSTGFERTKFVTEFDS